MKNVVNCVFFGIKMQKSAIPSVAASSGRLGPLMFCPKVIPTYNIKVVAFCYYPLSGTG